MDLKIFFFNIQRGDPLVQKKVIWLWSVKICTAEKICKSRSLLNVSKYLQLNRHPSMLIIAIPYYGWKKLIMLQLQCQWPCTLKYWSKHSLDLCLQINKWWPAEGCSLQLQPPWRLRRTSSYARDQAAFAASSFSSWFTNKYYSIIWFASNDYSWQHSMTQWLIIEYHHKIDL